MTKFIHLRLHSAYSLLEGALKIPDIVSTCIKRKTPALAITDTNNLFGALEFSVACTKAGIQPIIGCQALIKYEEFEGNLTLIVQSEEGYKNLSKILSDVYTKQSSGHFIINLQDILDNNAGLLCLTGGYDGLLATLIDKQKSPDALINQLKETFKDRLYIELQRLNMEDEEKFERVFLDIAKNKDIPIVATNNAMFKDADMFEAHDALMCISKGRYIIENDRPKLTKEFSLKSEAEMCALFEGLPEALENTVIIAKRCYFMPEPHAPMLPFFLDDKSKSEFDELKSQVEAGLLNRLVNEVYPLHDKEKHGELKKAYFARLKEEINIINTMGFCGYFLIVSDFIKWAKDQGIPVGPGRGSGAGSITAWALTITDLDPIRFDLIFERFLNPERVSMPDFDIDFCQDRRDEVIRYVKDKYGKDRVSQIITFGKLQARAVLRDVGRVLQIPYPVVDRVCKLVPANPSAPVTLAEALDVEPQLKQSAKEDMTVKCMIDIGLQLEGLYRHASTHAAGVVIADKPLVEVVPLYQDDKASLPATQFSMKYAEMAGLVKFDFLGLKTLTIIERASEMVRKKLSNDFSIHEVPLDDKKTFDLLCRVEAVGIFQLESAGMRDVLRQLQPDRFEDIIALVALYRPGPMDDIPRYLACKHGRENVTYLHPMLEPILSPTYGVMVYQEQVMKIAQVMGGYTLGGADLLRRAMGKKIKSEMNAQRQIFITGSVENGVKESIARLVFDQMAKFASYGFNKSHSAPYALLSYQTAYIKAHHPLEFMAATMTYDQHNTDKLGFYLQEIRRMNVELLPPNVQKSFTDFEVEGGNIRYSLGAVKNFGRAISDEIVKAREKGPFKNLEDFFTRVPAQFFNKRSIESLAAVGAFECFNPIRSIIYKSVDVISHFANAVKSQKESKQARLFGASESEKLILEPSPEWPYLEKLQKEFDGLGFFLSDHPLNLYQDVLKRNKVEPSTCLANIEESRNITLAGLILNVVVRTNKHGKPFAFIQASDQYGMFEVVVFSNIFVSKREDLQVGKSILLDLSARIDDEGKVRLNTQGITLFEECTSDFFPIKLKENTNLKQLQMRVNKLEKGSTKVVITFKPGKDFLPVRIILKDTYKVDGTFRSYFMED